MSNIEQFMEWLNEEIAELQMNHSDNLFIAGKSSEAVRIRAKLCLIDSLNKLPNKEEMERIAGEICDHYCMFPQAYGDREEDIERMIKERCDICPLEVMR